MAVKCLLTFPFFLFFLQSFSQQPHTETTVNIRNQRVKNRIHKYKSRHSVFKHGLRLFVSHNLSVYLRSKDSFLKHTSVKRSSGKVQRVLVGGRNEWEDIVSPFMWHSGVRVQRWKVAPVQKATRRDGLQNAEPVRPAEVRLINKNSVHSWCNQTMAINSS